MIFRAPAGHHLLSRSELEKIKNHILQGDADKAIKYLNHCLEEVEFYDDIRRMTELKKMYKEDGEDFKAQSLENKMLEKVRKRVEANRLIKESFLV